MRASIKFLGGILLAIGLGACGQPPPQMAPAATSKPNPFLNLDGTTNYDALRARYGAPNTNLRINPRATDVAQTPSRDSVTILPDRLVFEASDAAWLSTKHVGDTLYCNEACGGSGFGRNITSINAVGGQIVVLTTQASIPDIVQDGWLHATIPVTITFDKDGVPIATRAETNEGTKSEEVEHRWTGGVEADVKGTHSFTMSVDADAAYTWHGPSLRKPYPWVSVELVKFIAHATEVDSVEVSVEVKGGYNNTYKFFKKSIPLGDIPLGPVVLVPSLDIEPYEFIRVTGAGKVSAEVKTTKKMAAGFTYSDAAGLSRVFSSPDAEVEKTGTGSGELTAEAGFGLDLKFATKLYGVAGPYIGIDPELGVRAQGTIERKNTDGKIECTAEFKLGDFVKIDGKVGAELELFDGYFKIEDSYTFGEAEKFFPIIDKKTSLHSPSSLCPAEEGSTGTTSEPGSTTGETTSGTTGETTGGTTAGGTTGGSTAGGSTGGTGGTTGGGGPCVSDTDCSGGQMCCGGTCVEPTCCPGGETCTEYTNDSASVCNGGTCTCTCGDGTDCSNFSLGCRACATPPSTCL